MIIPLIIYSCGNVKKIFLKIYENGKAIKYQIQIPKKYSLVKTVRSDDGDRDIIIYYEDSTIIFLSDDIKSGAFINVYKSYKYGDNIVVKILANDTLNLEGIYEGKFWREKKANPIVLGYMNVPRHKKEVYDQVIESVKRID